MNGYIAFLGTSKIEVKADSLWAAKKQAAKIFSCKPGSKRYFQLNVVLAEKDGVPVIHSPGELP